MRYVKSQSSRSRRLRSSRTTAPKNSSVSRRIAERSGASSSAFGGAKSRGKRFRKPRPWPWPAGAGFSSASRPGPGVALLLRVALRLLLALGEEGPELVRLALQVFFLAGVAGEDRPRVDRDPFHVAGLEPLADEVPDEPLGTYVREHPADLRLQVLPQLPARRQAE